MINTDLAAEFAKEDGLTGEVTTTSHGIVKRIEVKDGGLFSERSGIYFHINCDAEQSQLEDAVADCVRQIAGDMERVLFVGLGNAKYISDSLGELVIDSLPISNNRTYKIKPQGARETGVETHDLILAAKKIVKPTLIIAIDSLATNNLNNVGKSIQITNVGLTPGSGVGNSRKVLSPKSLGIPIVAVGVPLVASTHSEGKNRLVVPIDIEDIAQNLAKTISNGIRQIVG